MMIRPGNGLKRLQAAARSRRNQQNNSSVRPVSTTATGPFARTANPRTTQACHQPCPPGSAKRRHCSSRLMASRPHRSASLTAVLLQMITRGESPKANATMRAAAAGRRHVDWGHRNKVSARPSITAMLARADGKRAAKLPMGSQNAWPGRL